MKERGFDTETYVDIQSKTILERVSKFGEKLYLEFGGKLSNDFHAARVLPGYQPNAKIQVLKRIQDMSEIYYCVSAKDIQRGRVRHDFGLSYDQQALKDIAFLSEQGLNISGVVITRYEGESLAERFYNKLQHQNIPVFLHREIPGYPLNIDLVVSEKRLWSTTLPPHEETHRHCHWCRWRQRQNVCLPGTNLPRNPTGNQRRFCQIRDFPHLESAH